MTNHEEKFRKIVEHNKKIVTDHYHLDYDKFLHQHIQEIGEYFRSITAKFTDKEMEDAMVLAYAIVNKTEPEDGISYEELAVGLGIYDNVKTLEDVPVSYKEKIDRLLYVLQYMTLEFEYNTTPEKGVNVGVNLVPVVKRTKKIRHSDGKIKKYNEAFEVIFNGVRRKYASEQFGKLGLTYKISKDDLLPEHLKPKDSADLLQERFDDKYKTDEERDQLVGLAEKIVEKFHEGEDVQLQDVLHILFPETKSMDCDEHNPTVTSYVDKIKDALDLIEIVTNSPAENRKLSEKLMKEKYK